MLLQLASIGILIALIPLCYVLVKGDRNKYRKLVWITAFLTLDLIMFGSFTRLTDSGLGCPDWPGCYGEASPWGARDDIAAAQAALPSGPVTFPKAWIEMIHRYLAMTVGALILAMSAVAWKAHLERSRSSVASASSMPISPWWPTVTLVWVIVQGLFGKYTVTLKLYPLVVTLHLLGGLLLLALLAMQHASFRSQPVALSAGLRRGVAVALLVVAMQSALGGWVSTNYAVLACTGFPQCNGAWWPAMDWAHGFDLLRHLGEGQSGGYLTLEALVAVHMAHRLFALVVAAVVAILAWRLWCLGNPVSRRFALGLALLLALQIATGLSNVVLDWPIVAALLHSAGAAFFVLLLTLLWARSRLNAPPLVAAGGLTGVGSLESPIRI